jgi:hypothetical protein
MRASLLLWGAATVLAITITVAFGWYLARQITTPLSLASKATITFARGESFPIFGWRLLEADEFLATLRTAQEELTRAQSHQKFLVRELQHRTQNLFSVI